MQIKKKIEWWEHFRVIQVYYLNRGDHMGRFDCKYNLQLVSSFTGWLLAVIQLYEYILFYFHLCDGRRGFWFMAIDTTFKNVSVISSVVLVDEIGVSGESQWSVQVTDKFYLIILHRVHLAMSGFELATLMVIITDCTCGCKSNGQDHDDPCDGRRYTYVRRIRL